MESTLTAGRQLPFESEVPGSITCWDAIKCAIAGKLSPGACQFTRFD